MTTKTTAHHHEDESESGPTSARLGVLLSSLAAAVVFGIFLLSVGTIWNARQDAWHEAEHASRNLLTAVTRDIRNSFELFDLSLQRVVRGLEFPGLKQLPPDAQKEILFDRATTMGLSRWIIVLDDKGDVIAHSASIGPRQANLADHEHFIVHRDAPGLGLYISRPFPGPMRNNELAVTLSRRLAYPDGSFRGVVVGSIAVTEISQIFEDLNLGQKGSITLLRGDGILLTRHPFVRTLVGHDYSQSPNIQRMLRETSGRFVGFSAVDGVERNFTFNVLDDFPLIVHVATSVDDIFANWRRRAATQGLITAVLCSSVMTLTHLFRRELRRREIAEAALERLARTDSLTGLPNRRAFDIVFGREWANARRTNTPLSLLFIDADFFKSYNDHYGHRDGDTLLRQIADVVRSQVRQNIDHPARYGGEEFTVLLPDTDATGAGRVAQRIRSAVTDLQLRHEKSPYNIITVSIGVATAFPSGEEGSDALVSAADAALYQAKAAGRNAVIAA